MSCPPATQSRSMLTCRATGSASPARCSPPRGVGQAPAKGWPEPVDHLRLLEPEANSTRISLNICVGAEERFPSQIATTGMLSRTTLGSQSTILFGTATRHAVGYAGRRSRSRNVRFRQKHGTPLSQKAGHTRRLNDRRYATLVRWQFTRRYHSNKNATDANRRSWPIVWWLYLSEADDRQGWETHTHRELWLDFRPRHIRRC